MKKLYISFDYHCKPIGVVTADDQETAAVAFMAMNNGHSTIEEIDLESDLVSSNKVTFLITSTLPDIQRQRKYNRGLS